MSSFGSETAVLRFGLRRHLRGADVESRALLWPVWAFRVMVPRRSERPERNMIEEAVFGLMRAGVLEASNIAQRLHLNEELIAYVVRDLIERGVCSAAGVPRTGECAAPAAVSPEWAFVDATSGEMWPRLVAQLCLCETRWDESTGAVLVNVGKSGRERWRSAFVHRPGRGVCPVAPEAAEVLRAARIHRTAERNSESDAWAEEEEMPLESSGVALFRRVGAIDAMPRALFVATEVYAQRGGGAEWFVADPFGLRFAPFMRRTVERAARESERLRSLIDKTLERANSKDGGGYVEAVGEWRALAAGFVERRVGGEWADGELRAALTEMEVGRRAWREMSGAGTSTSIASVLLAGRQSVEAVFAAMCDRWSTGEAWRSLYLPNGKPQRVKEVLVAVYNAAAERVGFSAPLPRSFLNTRAENLRNAAGKGGSWRLRAAAVAALMAAREDCSHPLWSVARRNGTFFRDVDRIAEDAGGKIHVRGGGRDVDVDAFCERVWRVVESVVAQSAGSAVSDEQGAEA